MSMKNIRDAYGVPAYQGRRVKWRCTEGTIAQSRGMLIGVRLDGDFHSSYFHPKDKDLRYLEEE